MEYLWAILITVLGIVFWLAGIIGLPGNWGLAMLAAAVAWLAPLGSFLDVHWATVAGLVAIAGLGELLEFVAGAAGVGKLGGSKRAAALALAGSIVGAFAGLFIGIPVPIVGSLIASLLFGGLGAWAGAMIGERWVGRSWENSLTIGEAAFKGRLLGTLAKTVCGAAMLAVLTVAVWF